MGGFMTEKQLYNVINKVEPRGQSVTYEGIPCTARTCVTRLNRLTEENEQLKTKVDFYKYFQKDARELEKENEQLKKENKQLKKDVEYYKTERKALFEYLDKKDDLRLELKVIK